MKKRGAVTLVFDDGYEHILRDIVPLLNSLGLKGVFAVPTHPTTTSMDGQPLTDVASWREITAQGHELAAHGITHRNFTTLPNHELEQELKDPSQQLPAHTIIYPGGAFNDEVVTVAKKYYQAGRGVKKGFETIPLNQPMQLKTFNFTRRNFSPLKANMLALWAYLTNSWLIETYHIVLNNSGSSKYAVSKDDFLNHMNFIKKLGIKNVTIKDFVSADKHI